MNAAQAFQAVKSRLLAALAKHQDFAWGFAGGVLLIVLIVAGAR